MSRPQRSTVTVIEAYGRRVIEALRPEVGARGGGIPYVGVALQRIACPAKVSRRRMGVVLAP